VHEHDPIRVPLKSRCNNKTKQLAFDACVAYVSERQIQHAPVIRHFPLILDDKLLVRVRIRTKLLDRNVAPWSLASVWAAVMKWVQLIGQQIMELNCINKTINMKYK